MQVVLVMFRSDGERRSFSVVRNMTVIGRREDCDLRIPVGDVSRKHCRLVRTDANIRIEDLGSSNGTYVNGTRVQESDLQPGDIVGIGPVQFIVQIDGVPDEREMTPPAQRLAASLDDEDSMIGHQMPQAEISPGEELEAAPAEEFRIEDELAAPEPAADDSAMDELRLEETPTEELAEEQLPLEPAPLAETPAAEIAEEEFSVEQSPVEQLNLDEEPLAEVPAESLAIEAEPLEFQPADTAAHQEFAQEELPAESLAEDDIPLEEIAPEATPAVATTSESPDGEAIELAHSLQAEEPLGDDFEFLDELEPEPAAPAPPAPPQPPAELKNEELLPIKLVEEKIEEVDLDSDETLPHDSTSPTDLQAASESDWDFVIEESDSNHSEHDFKVDLDSPHQQPHGQA